MWTKCDVIFYGKVGRIIGNQTITLGKISLSKFPSAPLHWTWIDKDKQLHLTKHWANCIEATTAKVQKKKKKNPTFQIHKFKLGFVLTVTNLHLKTETFWRENGFKQHTRDGHI